MSDRGWGLSCGATDPKRLIPGTCDHGYNHLMDTRFEVRDAQEVKAKIGVIGKGGPVPALPLAQPARVQLVNGAGTCWESSFGAPAQQNDAAHFKDKSD
jgi:hypothetical protein